MPHFFDLFSNSHMTPSIFLDVKILQVPWGDLRFFRFSSMSSQVCEGIPDSVRVTSNKPSNSWFMDGVCWNPSPTHDEILLHKFYQPHSCQTFWRFFKLSTVWSSSHHITHDETQRKTGFTTALCPAMLMTWVKSIQPSFTVSRRLRSAKILKDLWRHFKEWKDGTCLVFRNRYIIVKTVEPW